MTWKRKIPGEGACGPSCSWKERFNQLWDRAIGCITKINNITPDGDGKFEIRGGTGVQVDPISNGVEISCTPTGAGIATINNTAPDSDSNFTIAGASGRNGVTVTNSAHGVSLSIGDVITTVNDVVSDVFGNINLTAGSNITITPDNDNNSIEIAAAGGGVTPQDVQDALDAYAPMVRTTGTQTITGLKIFNGEILNRGGLQLYRNPLPDYSNSQYLLISSNSVLNTGANVTLINFTPLGGALFYLDIAKNSDDTISLNVRLQNTDGTYKTVELARSDVI